MSETTTKSSLVNGLRNYVLFIKSLGFIVTTKTISQNFENRLLLDVRASVPDAARITSIEDVPISIAQQQKDVIVITTDLKCFSADIYYEKGRIQ